MDEDLEALDVEDWEQDIKDDIESINSEKIEDEFYPEETNREIFFPKVFEKIDGENQEHSFNYYPRDLERIEPKLKNFGIKKLFKLRKTSPSNSKNTRLRNFPY